MEIIQKMLINIHCHSYTNNGLEILNCEGSIPSSFFSYGLLSDRITSNIDPTIITNNKCIAIGEIGLDKTFQTPINKQIEIFKKQVLLAKENELPILLHCVKAWNEIRAIKKEIQTNSCWIYHGFRKTSIASEVLNEGVFISIGTAVLFDKKLQECVKEIPMQKLFLETDATMEFSIQDVYEKVALLKNVSLQELEQNIFENFLNHFKKWDIGWKEPNY